MTQRTQQNPVKRIEIELETEPVLGHAISEFDTLYFRSEALYEVLGPRYVTSPLGAMYGEWVEYDQLNVSYDGGNTWRQQQCHHGDHENDSFWAGIPLHPRK